MAAKTLIVTTLIVGYAYIVEPFIAWYSGDRFERQFAIWRAIGWLSPGYWGLILCNVLIPLLLLGQRFRRSKFWLLFDRGDDQLGMWLERFVIIVGSTAHDFLPHNWGVYLGSPLEAGITIGSFCFFFLWFTGFVYFLPVVGISDVKEDQELEREHRPAAPEQWESPAHPPAAAELRGSGSLAVFTSSADLDQAVRNLADRGYRRLEAYSPTRVEAIEELLGRRHSPVRFFTLGGALFGLLFGFALAIGLAKVNSLIVGGKPPVSLLPYCIPGFEMLILFGALGNLTGYLIHTGLIRFRRPRWYDPRFSRDRFGLFIPGARVDHDQVNAALTGIEHKELRFVP